MSEFVQSTTCPDTVLVRVKPNELQCGSKLLQYSTYVGCISRSTGKVTVWEPAASKPRGYRQAVKDLLERLVENAKQF
jgi:hypothetical protein